MISEYGLMNKDVEIDMRILEDLINDVGYYRETYETDTEDPHRNAMNRENLEFAIEQYQQHKTYLLPRLEEWVQMAFGEESAAINISFYRVLHELRDQTKRGY